MQYVFLILLIGIVFSGDARANDNVITVFSSSAPDGQASPEPLVFEYLKNQLSDYCLNQEFAGLERSLQMMPHMAEMCVRNLVKNPTREALFDYSLPATVYLGMKMYLSPRAASLLTDQAPDTINLVDFAIKHNFVVGIDHERSYGAVIDAELAKLPKNNKYIKAGIESENRMARMLFSNRIDLWLEYQTVMDIFEREYLKDSTLKSFYVQGAAPYVFSHIACKKTPQSLVFIERVNQLLRQLYTQDSYYQFHIQFVSSSLQQNFDEVFKRFLAEQTH